MLYLFIAIPVQLWHHHKDPGSKASVVKISNTIPGNNLQSENCKICQHTYAPYVDTYPNFFIEPVIISTNYKIGVVTLSLDYFAADLSNKSPPAV